MTEFALALPILSLILALLLFMGWSMMRQQHVVAAGRYALWNHFDNSAALDGAAVNARLFKSSAKTSNITSGAFQSDGMKNWVDSATQNQVGALANGLFMQSWPGGQRITLEMTFPAPIRIDSRFGNDFKISFARDGSSWVKSQAQPWRVLLEQYYPDLDDALAAAPADGQPVASLFRSLYSATW